MIKDKWNIKFDWVQQGLTWIQQDRNEQYNENRFISLNDIYFKNSKYLSGVSYTYINKLQDIYKRDLLTGDGYSLTNMYNEYDIVDRVFKNIHFVEVATTSNLDITKQWYKIDGIQLKPNHLILLQNQDSEFENDVYRVTGQYFLKNAELLSTREKSEKFNVSVKSGTYKDKQFFLLNNGLEFPIIDEPKYFIEGNSFILKHIIKYNLYNTSSNSAITSKIIFTDYEIARKQLSSNYSLYYQIDFSVSNSTAPATDYFRISHHHEEYILRTGSTADRSFTGSTTQITNNTHPISGGTTITSISPFVANVGDYVNLIIFSGTTNYLVMNTFVKIASSNQIVLEDLIPNRILRNLSTLQFCITNNNIATGWLEAMSVMSGSTPYSRFYDISYLTSGSYYNITIKTKEYVYDKYFDYSDLTMFVVDGLISSNFTTTNNYINYNLFNRLNTINPYTFDSSFAVFDFFQTSSFSFVYVREMGTQDSTRIKLTFTNSGDTSYFTEFTYVYLNGDPSLKSLIDKIDGGDIYLEKPAAWASSPGSPNTPNVTMVTTINELGDISNLLQEVYINVDYSWYISKRDNTRRNICSAYAILLGENETFRRNVTGILYENEFNEFVLKLYDLENDTQLSFTTVELMYLGADKKTRFPVPLETLQETTTYTYDWNVLDGNAFYFFTSLSGTTEVFDFGFDVVLGGPNDPPLLFTIVDGNL